MSSFYFIMRSEVDKLFYELMEYSPKKKGAALEIITAAVFNTFFKEEVIHDEELIGESGAKYQIDVLIEKDEKVLVEVKDRTYNSNKKLEIGILREREGATLDLQNISEIFVVSATGFTSSAQEYAQGSLSNQRLKPIKLVDIRPSTEDDKEEKTAEFHLKIGGVKAFDLLLNVEGISNDEIGGEQVILYNTQGEEFDEFENLCISRVGYVKLNNRLYKVKSIKEGKDKDFGLEEIVSRPKGDPVLYLRYGEKEKLLTAAQLIEAINNVLIKKESHLIETPNYL